MLANLLRRYEPFTALEWSTLCSVARHARLLRLARHRTLTPTPLMQRGTCYLVKGSVRRSRPDQPDETIAANDAAARTALLASGDGAAVATLTPVTLVWVDLDPVEFLLGAVAPAGYPVEQLDAVADDHWMHRLLRTGLSQCLAPSELQAMFRSFTPMSVAAGTSVIEEGGTAEAFYVIANGIAQVRRGRRLLVGLAPGDSFGSDALLCGGSRNATVTMRSDGSVMRLSRERFDTLLAPRLVRWVERINPAAQRIDLAARPRGPDALRRLVGELDLGAVYLFDGGSESDRALAAYLATQRGVLVYARRDLPY